ncbi:MAG TPA: hypothetical protein VF533_00235 [Solirubrobacteraceae bacterium]
MRATGAVVGLAWARLRGGAPGLWLVVAAIAAAVCTLLAAVGAVVAASEPSARSSATTAPTAPCAPPSAGSPLRRPPSWPA